MSSSPRCRVKTRSFSGPESTKNCKLMKLPRLARHALLARRASEGWNWSSRARRANAGAGNYIGDPSQSNRQPALPLPCNFVYTRESWLLSELLTPREGTHGFFSAGGPATDGRSTSAHSCFSPIAGHPAVERRHSQLPTFERYGRSHFVLSRPRT